MKHVSVMLLVSSIIIFSACQSSQPSNTSNTTSTFRVDSAEILVDTVLTAEQQAKLTPDDVLAILKTGNDDFIGDSLTIRNSTARVRRAALGQYPKAVILSCLDSRVPVEDVFHRGIGDVFVARVAGNFVNEDILGSMEFGCKVAGAKLILVLGHEYCGAIKSAIDDVKLGNITAMLSKIRPAVTSLSTYTGDKTSKNDDFVHAVCEQNVKLTVQQITAKSSILKELVDQGKLKVVGGIYNMNTGKVDFLQ
jgi:carbonic anhydrase